MNISVKSFNWWFCCNFGLVYFQNETKKKTFSMHPNDFPRLKWVTKKNPPTISDCSGILEAGSNRANGSLLHLLHLKLHVDFRPSHVTSAPPRYRGGKRIRIKTLSSWIWSPSNLQIRSNWKPWAAGGKKDGLTAAGSDIMTTWSLKKS